MNFKLIIILLQMSYYGASGSLPTKENGTIPQRSTSLSGSLNDRNATINNLSQE